MGGGHGPAWGQLINLGMTEADMGSTAVFCNGVRRFKSVWILEARSNLEPYFCGSYLFDPDWPNRGCTCPKMG